MIQELEDIHSSSKLAIMEMFHDVEKIVEKIEDGCKFSERILANGNAVELLVMKKQITLQMLTLLNNIPRPEMNIKIDFLTDNDKFEAMVKAMFGHFRRDDKMKKVNEC